MAFQNIIKLLKSNEQNLNHRHLDTTKQKIIVIKQIEFKLREHY